METVTALPRFQVVIPRSVRDALNIHPGEKIIEFVPLKVIKRCGDSLRGLTQPLLGESTW